VNQRSAPSPLSSAVISIEAWKSRGFLNATMFVTRVALFVGVTIFHGAALKRASDHPCVME
jgi:hypothetical protein